MANWMKTPDDPHQQPSGEPRFGKQCKDSSSCSSLPSKNPGENVMEKRPPSSGASYDRAGGPSGQPTKQIPESQYSTESSEK
jgi:hypothetical protein